MKKYLIVKVKKEMRIVGGCSPDDPKFDWVVDNCFDNTGEYFLDKKTAIKNAKSKNSKKNQKESYGVIKIDIP